MSLNFGWQEKCLDLVLQGRASMDSYLDEYSCVSARWGSGKKYLGSPDHYFCFMERKWQITYAKMLRACETGIEGKIGEVYGGDVE